MTALGRVFMWVGCLAVVVGVGLLTAALWQVGPDSGRMSASGAVVLVAGLCVIGLESIVYAFSSNRRYR